MPTVAVDAFTSGFPHFLVQVGAALGLYVLALLIYVLLTPHKELQLIQEGNPSAAVAFGGVVIGLAIPIQVGLANASGLIDLAVWGVVTLLLQLIAFRVVDVVLVGLPRRIAEGDVAAALFVFSVKIGLALILAGGLADPNVELFGALDPTALVRG